MDARFIAVVICKNTESEQLVKHISRKEKKAKFKTDFFRRLSELKVLLVGENEDRDSLQLLLLQKPLQFYSSILQTFDIGCINDEDLKMGANGLVA